MSWILYFTKYADSSLSAKWNAISSRASARLCICWQSHLHCTAKLVQLQISPRVILVFPSKLRLKVGGRHPGRAIHHNCCHHCPRTPSHHHNGPHSHHHLQPLYGWLKLFTHLSARYCPLGPRVTQCIPESCVCVCAYAYSCMWLCALAQKRMWFRAHFDVLVRLQYACHTHVHYCMLLCSYMY